MNPKPTIGRIVRYKSYGTPNAEYHSEPRAAIITAVHDEEAGVVDLCVINPTGLFFNQRVNFGTREGQWSWTPIVHEKTAEETAVQTNHN